MNYVELSLRYDVCHNEQRIHIFRRKIKRKIACRQPGSLAMKSTQHMIQ